MSSYLEELRAKLKEKAQDAASNKSRNSNDTEFTPDVGTYKIRILPPLDPKDLFYHTHSYNYLEGVGEINEETGKRRDLMLFSQKFFNVDGKRVRNPIDELVFKLYKTKDEADKNFASKIKRKRRFYMNVLLIDAATGEATHKVLVDNSNEGKLTRVICNAAGVPFMRDVEDNWFDESASNIDEDRRYFDLFDIKKGHDFKIVKDKIGNDKWQITYEKSFAIDKPRALTEAEVALLDARVDLKTYIAYESDINKVQSYLDMVLDNYSGEPSAPKTKSEPSPSPKRPAPVKKPEAKPTGDVTDDDVLNALDED